MKNRNTKPLTTTNTIEDLSATRLRSLRRRLGYDQSRMADELGIKVRTLRGWEQGSRKPETYSKLTKRLNQMIRIHEKLKALEGAAA